MLLNLTHRGRLQRGKLSTMICHRHLPFAVHRLVRKSRKRYLRLRVMDHLLQLSLAASPQLLLWRWPESFLPSTERSVHPPTTRPQQQTPGPMHSSPRPLRTLQLLETFTQFSWRCGRHQKLRNPLLSLSRPQKAVVRRVALLRLQGQCPHQSSAMRIWHVGQTPP